MDREDYRKAFDELSFSADFQARTAALLQTHARELEKEKPNMHFKKTRKLAVLIAAAVAVLAVSVSAAVLFLNPADVAEQAGEPAVAAAFQSENAIAINESAVVGDYTVTLDGMVSGADLGREAAEYNGEIISDRTYAVYHVARTDGAPLKDYPDLAYTPLVEGYHVSAVNAWTLGTGTVSFIQDGVAYHLFDTRNLEMFADHTVYFAVYEGFAPGTDTFSMAKDGAISLREGVNGVLFTLPLDADKADPAAARAFVEATGMVYEPMTDAERAALPETAAPAVIETEGEDGEKRITIGGSAAQTDGELEPFTAESFKTYMAGETERLKRQLADGVLSQETYDKTVAELEEVLAGLEDGTLVAFLDGDDLVTGTASNGEYDLRYSKTGDGAVGITIADAK